MREIQAQQITDVVEKLCIEANQYLPKDVQGAIRRCRACEDWEIAQGVLDKIITNFEIAEQENVPICQDTGMACVFLEIAHPVQSPQKPQPYRYPDKWESCHHRQSADSPEAAPVSASPKKLLLFLTLIS